MSTIDVEATVRALADTEAIRDLARRYAHCVWTKDVPGAVGLFTDDGEMDTGERPPIRGRTALLESYQNMITGPTMYPYVHQHLIDLDGDRATGVCYLDLRATLLDGVRMSGFGYYHDVYVRVAGEWKFRSRKLVLREYAPLPGGSAGAKAAG
ncbi:MAG: nuclear transport factor 2 family protein [Deltaproteobacteria bacterium]|nr:nuclear transport factor 2 family protein [Deltaproteobacteria bacterium]